MNYNRYSKATLIRYIQTALPVDGPSAEAVETLDIIEAHNKRMRWIESTLRKLTRRKKR